MIIFDARGNPWTFDENSHTLYRVDAAEGSNSWNGFICDSWQDAIAVMNDSGFMDKATYPQDYR